MILGQKNHSPTKRLNTIRILRWLRRERQISALSPSLCVSRIRAHHDRSRPTTTGAGSLWWPRNVPPLAPAPARQFPPAPRRSALLGLAWISPVRDAKVGLDLTKMERAEGCGAPTASTVVEQRPTGVGVRVEGERGYVDGGEAQGGSTVLRRLRACVCGAGRDQSSAVGKEGLALGARWGGR